MKINKLVVILFFAIAQHSFGQVKIGNDINTIDSASILELESTDKVLILTRVTNTQMAAITPLSGAMVYNTDEGCIFQYNGILWQSLCDTSSFNETNTIIFDNNDGTFSYTNENNITVAITKAQLSANGDGTFSFTNGNGTPVNFDGTDNQVLSTDGTSGNLTLENGGTLVLNVADADADDTNELNTGFTLNGTALEITDAGGTIAQDLNGTFATDAEVGVVASASAAAIQAVQDNVDINEADADAAITAETTRATAAENAIQADVDANETAATNAINAVQTDVDTNEADADAAIAAANTAIALKEDAANKSTNVALGTSDVDFPTQNAVKTYVDAQVAGSTQVIVSTDANNDVTAGADGGAFYDDAALQTSIANNTTAITTETTRATAAENAIQADVDANETAATNAINAVQTDVDTNEADADAAIALKEDAANKSTNVALGTSDVDFPTQNAVKTYVDAQVAGSTQVIVSTDADNNVTAGADGGAFYDDATLQTNIANNTTNITSNDTDIANNTTAITAETTRATAAENAIQADVDANETAATNAINAVQTDVDTNEADADAAIALKEDAANKSTNVALGTSDVDFPTQNAVKTYVDAQVAGSTQVIVSTDADNDVTAGADGGAFYDDATLQTNIAKNTTNITSNDTDIANNTTAITAETTRATAAENAIQADVDANETAATNAINAVQTDVDTNEADADAAIALKEDAANKSTNVALGTSDVDFPTQNAVKTYVDAQVAGSTQVIVSTDANNDVTAGADGGAFYDDAALQTNIASNDTDIANNTTAITAETTRATAAENAIQADVDANETAATNAINAVQTDVDTNEADADAAIALKEDAANKSTNVALGTSDVDFPTQNAVKTYVDAQVLASDQVIVSTDADNDVTAGADGGAFYDDATLQTNIANNTTAITAETTRATAAENAIQADVDTNEADADGAIALKEDAANKSTNVALGTSDVDFPTQNAVKTYVDAQADGTITSTDIDVTGGSNAAFENVSLSIADNAITTSKIANDNVTLDKLANGTSNGQIMRWDGTNWILSNETITKLESPAAAQNTLVYTDEANGVTTLPNIVRSVNGVNPQANGNVAVILSSVSTGMESARPATGVDSDIYIVSGEVAPNTDRNGVAFIYDDPTGWQEVTTDLSTNDARYVNIIGDAMTGPLTMGGNAVTSIANPVNAQDATPKSYVDAQIIASTQVIVSTDANNDVTTGADGGAFYDDATLQTNIANNTTNITSNDTDIANNVTAIALKEDAANKSTNVALGTSDVDFPTQNAVKTYVDAQVAGSTQVIVSTDADNDVTAGADGGAFYDDATLQTNIANNTTAITAETTRATAAENAIQADVDANETAATNAINAVQTDVDTNEADADAAIAAANTAIALKEDAANKSTNVSLGTSDVDFPTQNAVKTYVDAQVAGSTQVIVSTDANNDVTTGADGGAFYDDAALQTNIANNTTNITSNDTDIANNVTAIALKEDAANKSTNVALGTSDVDFPTQNAVKTYVDAQVAGSTQVIVSTDADNDVTAGADGGAFYDDATLQTNIANNTTAITAETTRATAAENAIQADVDANETAATNAINAVQTDVDTNEADADAAIAAANTAIALKEDAANKSTNVALGTSDVDFPTQNAVKTYVDAQVLASDQVIVSTDANNDVTAGADGGAFYDDATLQTNIANNTTAITAETTRATAAENAIQADVDANETAATNAINAVQTDVDTNEADADAAIALKEDAANKSTNVALGTSDVNFPTQNAVKTYVDAQVAGSTQVIVSTDTDNDVTAGADGGAFYDDATLQTNITNNTTAITAETARATAAENAIQADVDANETAANTAIALKEDAANKSTNVALGTSDVDFPTQNAVKTYVDAQKISGTSGSLFFAGATGAATEDNSQLFWDITNNRLGVGTDMPENKLQVSGAIRSAGLLNSDGTVGEPAYRFSDDTNTGIFSPAADEIGLTVGGIEAINIDETSGNTTVTINETLDLDGQVLDENDSSGNAGQVLTATATGTEWVNNSSPIKAFGKISSTGALTRVSTGVTVIKQSGVGHYRVVLTGIVSDGNYIIQLSQPGRGGVGNDDPGISYSNQTATGFDVIMGDNDNGGTDRARFDSEFMFVILDL
ncbi:hypothetical protein M4I21_14850 [Cellulophaga sp. 20_2_10]|uniref:beta strand repeat-containing protein n=1 Tax=Cellulophaga sp. 20_2_10 TaxID=2942476 RepID=UPI00201B1389|nr:hypothetical protein [Cellulophaga sp. 20_2_10]MCL5247098.1 hypothetical protein [Cellulophaga sp. 20_2_10]